MIKLFKLFRNKKLNKKFSDVYNHVLGLIDQIVLVLINRNESTEAAFHLKRDIKKIDQGYKKEYFLKLEKVNQLLDDLYGKLENNEVKSIDSYLKQAFKILKKREDEEMEKKKQKGIPEENQDFMIDVKIDESCCQIEIYSRKIKDYLETANNMDRTSYQYQLISNEYKTAKLSLQKEMNNFQRLLSTKHRNETAKIILARQAAIEEANCLLAFTFEDTQEMLLDVTTKEKEFDAESQSWTHIHEGMGEPSYSLYDDELSKDLEQGILKDTTVSTTKNTSLDPVKSPLI
jgi:hypothetical protein